MCVGVTSAARDDPPVAIHRDHAMSSSSLAMQPAAPESAPPSTVRSIIYLGIDGHKDSLTIAVLPCCRAVVLSCCRAVVLSCYRAIVLPSAANAPTRVERRPYDLRKLKQWLDRLAREGELRACYEASGAE